MKTQIVECPYCENPLDIDIAWAIKNELVFCTHCCKSFPVKIDKDKVKKMWDEGVKQILEDEKEPNFYWDEF